MSKEFLDKLHDIAQKAANDLVEFGADSCVVLVTVRDGGSSYRLTVDKGNWFSCKGVAHDYLNNPSVKADQEAS